MALNIIGVPTATYPPNGVDTPLASNSPHQAPNYSIQAQVQMADMMLDVNVDPLTASKIRQLDQQKQAAVAREDYDQAKQMKMAIQKLTQMGIKIGQLERAKQAAVQKEDYDLAKTIKQDIDQLRLVGEQNILNNKPDINQQALPVPSHQTQHSIPVPSQLQSQTSQLQQQQSINNDQNIVYQQQLQNEGAIVGDVGELENYNQSQDFGPRKSKQQEYDERPAQGRGSYFGEEEEQNQQPVSTQGTEKQGRKENIQQKEEVVEQQSQVQGVPAPSDFPPPGAQENLPDPTPLSERDRQECDELVQLVGEYVCQCWKSKNWQLRDAAVRYVEEHVNKGKFQHEGDLRSAGRLAAGGLKDTVGFVSNSCLRLLDSTIAALGRKGAAGQREIGHLVMSALPALLDMTASNNTKTREQTRDFFLVISQKNKGLISQMMPHLLKPVKSQAAWRPVLARLELFDALLATVPVTTNEEGFTLEPFMKFIGAAFGNPNKDVRNMAVKLTGEAGKQVGAQNVRRLLPNSLNHKLKEQIDLQLGLSPASKPILTQRTHAPTNESTSKSTSQNQKSMNGGPNKEDAKVLEEELRRLEKQYGKDHPTVGNTLANLAIIHSNKGETGKALQAYQRALAIQEKHFGKDSQPVAHTLTDIAVLHLEEGRDAQGRPLLERALAIQEGLLGPDHEDVKAIKEVLYGED